MDKDEWLGAVLALCMKGLLYHSLACVLYWLPPEKTPSLCMKLLVLFVPLMLFAVIRSKSQNFFAFILLHVVISGGFVLIFDSMGERITAGICVTWIAIASVTKRFTKDLEESCPPMGAYLLFLGAYALASKSGRPYLMDLCCLEASLFLILFVSYRRITATSAFLKSNDQIKNLPAGQLKGLNRIMFGVFLLFFIASMLLVPHLPADTVLEGAAALLRLIIRGAVWLLLRLFSRDTPDAEMSGQALEQSMQPLEAGRTSRLMQILDKLFLTILTVLLAAALLYLAVRLLYQMYRRFYEQHRQNEDESEFLWKSPALKERIVRQRREKENLSRKGINYQIRRLYKKRIRRRFGREAVIQPEWTPTQWERVLQQQQDAQMLERILIYEKARYSQHECGRQELEAFKQNLKQEKNN